MAIDQIIEAVTNSRTKKVFILLEELGGRLKVINPQGETMVLPANVFDDPEIIEPNDFAAQLSTGQLTAYELYLEEGAEDLDQEKIRAKDEAARPAPPGSSRTRRKAAKKAYSRTGLGATWDASKLIFYRHKIEPLDPKQTFRIAVSGVGTFEISKEIFQSEFNDVIVSAKYRQEGMYIYFEIPDKAQRFFKECP